MPASDPALRVLLVDDHRVVRAGLRMLLDAEEGIEVVDEAGDVRDAVFKTRRHTPDLVVLDVMLPDGDGVDAIERLRAEAPEVKVLILSMEDDPHHVRRAFSNGASGYVLKDAAEDELVTAIREVSAGGRYLHPELGARMVQTDMEERERQASESSVRPRARGAAAARPGPYQPGDRGQAVYLGAHRRDAPRAHHAEARIQDALRAGALRDRAGHARA